MGVPLKHRESTIVNEQNAARAVLDTGQFDLGVAADDSRRSHRDGVQRYFEFREESDTREFYGPNARHPELVTQDLKSRMLAGQQ